MRHTKQIASRTRRRSSLVATLIGAGWTLLSGAPALADDTEIFVNPTAGAGIKPNLLLILDTSGSMNSQVNVTRLPYDPGRSYSGSCESDRVYFATGAAATPPSCSGDRDEISVRDSVLRCNVAVDSLELAGFWTGRALQFDEDDAAWSPLPLDDNDAPVECEADAGVHGPFDSSPRRYAQNGNDDEPWTTRAVDAIEWREPVVTFYSPNYLNWLNSPDELGTLSRLDVLKAVAKQMILSLDNMRVGIMRFSNNGGEGDAQAEGGMVVHEVADVRTARASLLEVIDNLTAAGFTPLAETLYESGQYWAGREVDYGVNSRLNRDTPFPSITASRRSDDSTRYRSPIQFSCQRNFTVLFTDGEPTSDRSALERVPALPDYASVVGQPCNGETQGECFEQMAAYLNRADLSSTINGRQNTDIFTIGFGPEVEGSTRLAAVAAAGGGRAYSADSVDTLSAAFQDIIGNVRESAATFTTPAVGINAFNRTQTLNDLYVSVFQPSERLRWVGNLKKFSLEGGQIVDENGNAAIDESTGFFNTTSQSIWSEEVDGDQVLAGGAVSQLPEPASRRIFTFLSSLETISLDAFDVSNSRITNELLGVTPDGYTREQIIGWTRGEDVRDLDGDGNLTEAARSMGDPLHARPALVSYGGDVDDPDPRDSIVLVPTNDGVLHAIDASTGEELWAFVAPELLPRLQTLIANPSQSSRSYGLDGDVRVLKFDRNQNGIVEEEDRVWAYFGMRRGGRYYYALDITDRADPKMKFILGPDDLPGLGETWSTPAIARVRVGGTTQNGENLVLIFGGGYDASQQNYTYREDDVGNRVFMVDAASGNLLWWAGPPAAGGADLELDRMTHSIPSRIVTMDIDGDQFADRMYAADMGGRVWRFDIFNGADPRDLVTGGVFARLGAGDAATVTRANTRRFYYAPDVALIQRRGADPYYNLAIGSGYRGHPLETDTRDRFYSLRDKLPFTKLTQAQYNSFAPVTESDLVNITTDPGNVAVPTTARGWFLELQLNGGWRGEKVLAESLTLGGVVLFPTYQPQEPSEVDPCSSANGLNRVYALTVDTGKAAIDFNDDDAISSDDLSTTIVQPGIAGEVTFAFDTSERPNGGSGNGGGGGSGSGLDGADALGRRAVCFVGVEVLKRCVLPGSVVRTFWQRVGTE